MEGQNITAAVETSRKVLEGKAPPAVIMQVQSADLLSLHYAIVILSFLSVCVRALWKWDIPGVGLD